MIETEMQIESRERSYVAAAFASAGTVSVALAGLAALQYAMPPGFHNVWGTHSIGLRHYRHMLGLEGIRPIRWPLYCRYFRILLTTAYAAYLLMLLSARRLHTFPMRKAMGAVGCLTMAIAIFFPPNLSADSYAYVAYARMSAVHGMNPYVTAPDALIALRDPVAPFLRRVIALDLRTPIKWDIPTVYGPVWTVLSVALDAPISGLSIWVQDVAMKLVEALAVCLAAYAAWRTALRIDPRSAPAAFLGIAFNPLLLVEGPGSGHNDVLLMSLVITCAWQAAEGRLTRAALALGLSVGIKFITLAIVPWLLWEHRGRLKKPLAACAVAAALLLPTVVTFAPYWNGMGTLSAIIHRGEASVVPTNVANTVSTYTKLSTASSLQRYAPAIIAFLLLSIVVMTVRTQAWWLAAWTLLAIVLTLVLLPIRFPWYGAWTWTTAAARWNRQHGHLSAFCGGAAFALSWCYTLSDKNAAGACVVEFLCLTVLTIIAIDFWRRIERSAQP